MLKKVCVLAALIGAPVVLWGCAQTPAQPAPAAAEAAPVASPEALAAAAKKADDQGLECDDDYELGSHVKRHVMCTTAADRAATAHVLDGVRATAASQGGH